MAEPRPYVINAEVINLLNRAPVTKMRPNLGSEIQRKTIEVGCFPFPFMVNEDNIPLDGRTIQLPNGQSVTLPVRPVPFWCSENAYAKFPGDTSLNNGKIVWQGGVGAIRSSLDQNRSIGLENAFRYDSELGVTYPTYRASTAFVGLENTVPIEWIQVKNAVFGSPSGFDDTIFGVGETFDIANNLLFRVWSGLTFDAVTGSDNGSGQGISYEFKPMSLYNANGGTYSGILNRYNYGCLDQIFNSTKFDAVGLSPSFFWEGQGASYGSDGGMSGELFLLNAVTGGNKAGSYYVFSTGSDNDILLQTYFLLGVSGGNTIDGRQLALNIYNAGNDPPFISPDDPPGGLIETFALLLGTNQKTVPLPTGGTASLRGLDFNNPCSASFQYDTSTNLGKWGYKVLKLGIGDGVFQPPPPPLVGCNRLDFIDYIGGSTGIANGIVHPISWMYHKGVTSGGAITEYALAYMHDYIGDFYDDGSGNFVPNYVRLEGLQDYLCYEILKGNTVESRAYYPIRPINSEWYDSEVRDKYDVNITTGFDAAFNYGSTLDQKYYTAFKRPFRATTDGEVSLPSVSLMEIDGIAGGINVDTPNSLLGITGVTGVMFPYLIPLASFAMDNIGEGGGDITISGEFDYFAGWNKALFGLVNETETKKLYQYYADGVSSDANFTDFSTAPQEVATNSPPNFRLFSWNLLNRIKAREYGTDRIVNSSFAVQQSDPYGIVKYTDQQNNKTMLMDGIDVIVDPRNYPPAAIPFSQSRTFGLTFSYVNDSTPTPVVRELDCGSYVNIARYANRTPPNVAEFGGAYGLTANSEVIAQVSLSGQTEKSLADFEPIVGEVEVSNTSNSFKRTADSPNSNINFYTTPGNFFFTTSAEEPIIPVFSGRYYLTAQEYYTKYVENSGNGSLPLSWWENVNNDPANTATIAGDIFDRLINPTADDLWSQSTVDTRFKGSPYFPSTDFDLGTNGIFDALQTYRVHPAFVYRLFTTASAMETVTELGDDFNIPYSKCCARNWTILDGTNTPIPCHQYQPLLQSLFGSFTNYFNSGLTGCDSFGQQEVADSEYSPSTQYKDFFYRAKTEPEQFGTPPIPAKYAYGSAYFTPFSTEWGYQNADCGGGGGSIQDPPVGASLTPFGEQFAQALNVLRKDVGDSEIPLTSPPIQIRDQLFAFAGSTATGLPDGSDNNVGANTVSAWLNERLSKFLDYYNQKRATPNSDLQIIDSVLTTLYPNAFPVYKNALSESITYRLRTVKPKCLEQWTPDCADVASKLLSLTTPPIFRLTNGFGSPDNIFFDEQVNADIPQEQRISRPSILDVTPVIGSNTTVLTSNDIIPQNEGFVGAFRTIYIEPLGLAENVLATEAQAVPRATISSTVFGKIATVIDSGGFIRDVNLITFESGFGTKITGNNSSGIINISVDGLTLGSLVDVGISGASSGDILVYDGESQRWVNRSFADVIQPFLAGLTGFTGSFEPGTNFFYQDSAPDAGITIGSRWMNSNTGIEYIYISDGDSFQWIQSSVDVTAETPTFTYNTTLVTGSEYAALDTDYYIGVSYAGPVLIQLPSEPDEGKTVIVKDAAGFASYENRKITVVGATGSDTIDNEASAIINVNNGALQFIYKNGWRII